MQQQQQHQWAASTWNYALGGASWVGSHNIDMQAEPSKQPNLRTGSITVKELARDFGKSRGWMQQDHTKEEELATNGWVESCPPSLHASSPWAATASATVVEEEPKGYMKQPGAAANATYSPGEMLKHSACPAGTSSLTPALPPWLPSAPLTKSSASSYLGSGIRTAPEAEAPRGLSLDSDCSTVDTSHGAVEIPTAGSIAHFNRNCKPCAFVFKGGCNSGFNCAFCHLCGPDEKKRRKKAWRYERHIRWHGPSSGG